MQFKTYIKISSIMSGALLAGLFVLLAIMPGLADRWVNAGTELNTVQKVLIGLAAFWSRFSWLAFLPVIIGVFFLVGMIAVLQRAFANKRLE